MDHSPAALSWRTALLDWGPVVVVAVLGTTGFGMEEPWSGSDLELAVIGLCTALPLGWRRSRPVLVATAIACVIVAQRHLLEESLGFGSFCAFLIASFSLARYLPAAGRAVAAVSVLFLAVLVATSEAVEDQPAEVVFPLVYCAGAFLVGRGMRHLAEQAERLRRLTLALERERDSRALLAIAEERLHWSRELHDVVGHSLTSMVVQAAAAEEHLPRNPDAAIASVRAVQDTGRAGLRQLRHLVEVLREEPSGATPDLSHELEAVVQSAAASGLDVSLRTSGDVTVLPAQVATTVVRLGQESLTNVLRHSRARTASIALTATDRVVIVEVRDPGPSAPNRDRRAGRGLTGLSERVRLLGGELVTGPDGTGFSVRATLPVEATR